MKKKKIFIGVLVFLIVAVGLALLDPDEEDNKNIPDVATANDNNSVDDVQEPAANEDELINPYEGRKAEIYEAVSSRAKSGDYTNATFTDIKINDDLGSDAEGDYILLVYGKIDINNSKETGNKLLRMYADDLMASVAGEGIADISEGVVFWKDDYNSRTVKYSYEYQDGDFYISDVMGE